ncbi:MAG: hypothetical protein N3D11_16250 [Candidatus Sumerlaeia bacterium]|nr:hypothetical protein [Candidatus Sumerlaeia bacterium]
MNPSAGRKTFPPTALWIIVAALLISLSWWNSAFTAMRILALWLVAAWLFERAPARVSEGQMAFLAALVAVGVVHLILFPAAEKPFAAACASLAVLLSILSGFVRQAFPATQNAKPFPHWNRWLAAGVGASALLLLLSLYRASAGRPPGAADSVTILAPLGYLLLMGEVAAAYRDTTRRPLVRHCLFWPPCLAVCVTVGQMLAMGIETRRSAMELAGGSPAQALRQNTAAMGFNSRLRLPPAENRLLLMRARIFDRMERPDAALAALLQRRRNLLLPPTDPMLRQLCDDYLSTRPLEPHIAALSHPSSLWRFEQLPLPKDAAERSFLLGLFARRGLLDRLMLYDAQYGWSENLDFGYLLESFEQAGREADSDAAAWLAYFKGICAFHLGLADGARSEFHRVLAQWPDDHNTHVWLERLGDPAPDTSATGPRATMGRIANERMIGNHRWGLNLDDALWTALEVRPESYRFHFEVRGLAGEGEWPILQVYLNGQRVLEQPVQTDKWTSVAWQMRFEADGHHRLVVAFANDVNKTVKGRRINRNLYLREIRIETAAATDGR